MYRSYVRVNFTKMFIVEIVSLCKQNSTEKLQIHSALIIWRKKPLIISVSSKVVKSVRMWVSFLIMETFHQFFPPQKESCTNAIRLNCVGGVSEITSKTRAKDRRLVGHLYNNHWLALLSWQCKRQWPTGMMHFLKLYLPFIRIVMGNRAISSRETI